MGLEWSYDPLASIQSLRCRDFARHGRGRNDFIRFEHGIRDLEELIECHLVSGGFDYLLKFVVRGIPHYQEMMEGILEKNIGISKYFSYIVIKSPIVRGQPSVRLQFPPG